MPIAEEATTISISWLLLHSSYSLHLKYCCSSGFTRILQLLNLQKAQWDETGQGFISSICSNLSSAASQLHSYLCIPVCVFRLQQNRSHSVKGTSEIISAMPAVMQISTQDVAPILLLTLKRASARGQWWWLQMGTPIPQGLRLLGRALGQVGERSITHHQPPWWQQRLLHNILWLSLY